MRRYGAFPASRTTPTSERLPLCGAHTKKVFVFASILAQVRDVFVRTLRVRFDDAGDLNVGHFISFQLVCAMIVIYNETDSSTFWLNKRPEGAKTKPSC